jgi:2-polyprenyl-6-hydroxyphenyl methylase/3-demethylubiquinone-9 3-methyltransferase
MGEAPLSVARLHQLESGVEVDYRQSTAEQLAEEMPGASTSSAAWRCSSTCRTRRPWWRLRRRLAAPRGTCSFSTINRNPKAFLFAIVGAEHLLRLLPAGTHDYEKFIRPSELAQWLRDADLQLGA